MDVSEFVLLRVSVPLPIPSAFLIDFDTEFPQPLDGLCGNGEPLELSLRKEGIDLRCELRSSIECLLQERLPDIVERSVTGDRPPVVNVFDQCIPKAVIVSGEVLLTVPASGCDG